MPILPIIRAIIGAPNIRSLDKCAITRTTRTVRGEGTEPNDDANKCSYLIPNGGRGTVGALCVCGTVCGCARIPYGNLRDFLCDFCHANSVRIMRGISRVGGVCQFGT